MGAGDELMAAGIARAHHRATGRPVKIRMRPGSRVRWHEAWNGLPYLLREDDARPHDVQYARDERDLRPYIAGKTDERWTWRRYTPLPAELAFTAEERAFWQHAANAIVIEPNTKQGASPNKDWGRARWQALVDLRPDLPWLQLGPYGTRLLRGVRHLATPSFRHAAAALVTARAAVLPEGGLHHAAAAVGTPAVVLHGGFIAPQVTGYAGQRALFRATPEWPLGCGSRVPCAHCAAIWNDITPGQVLAALGGILEEPSRPLAA